MKLCTELSFVRAMTPATAARGAGRKWACLLGVVTLVAGCGERVLQALPTHAVKGRVVLRNGKPLSAGRVVFVPVEGLTPSASGDVAPDGSFTLSTRAPGDGAAAGDYKVRVEPGARPNQKISTVARTPFPLKYIDEDSSGVFVTVKAGTNTLDPITLR